MADITSRQFDLSRVKENLKLFKVFAMFASDSISRVSHFNRRSNFAMFSKLWEREI